VRREQANHVTERLELSGPVMSGVARFQDHGGRRLLHEEPPETIAGKPSFFVHFRRVTLLLTEESRYAG